MGLLFIMDIDGTIAHAGRRFKEAGPEPMRDNKEIYDQWVSSVQNKDSILEDAVVPGMIDLVYSLRLNPNVMFYYLTSREERWRDTTMRWLTRKGFAAGNTFGHGEALIMRPNGDYSEVAIFKEQVIKRIQRWESGGMSVIVCDDDGQGTIEPMCKKNGWTFLKARSGGQE